MVKLPRLSGHDLIKILAKFGFFKVRQKGSHAMLIKETKQEKLDVLFPCMTNWKWGHYLVFLGRQKSVEKNFSRNLKNKTFFRLNSHLQKSLNFLLYRIDKETYGLHPAPYAFHLCFFSTKYKY
jgi:predicted RNA binding protein YcfA (HicA-like mRNA interferase family)